MAQYYDWQSFFQAMNNWGLTDVLLPFLLIFTVVFAIFQKTKILGERKGYNVTIAFVLALLTIMPHVTGSYPLGYDPVELLKNALPSVSIVVIAVIMLLLMVGIWGVESDWVAANTVTGGIVIVSAAVIFYIFGAAAGWWHGWSWIDHWFGSDAMAIVIMILVFAIVIWFVTRDETKTKGDGMMKHIGEMFRKK